MANSKVKHYVSDGVLVRRVGQNMSEVWADQGGWRSHEVDTSTCATPIPAQDARKRFPAAFPGAGKAPVRR